MTYWYRRILDAGKHSAVRMCHKLLVRLDLCSIWLFEDPSLEIPQAKSLVPAKMSLFCPQAALYVLSTLVIANFVQFLGENLLKEVRDLPVWTLRHGSEASPASAYLVGEYPLMPTYPSWQGII